MNSSGSDIVFSAQSSAATSELVMVDNDQIVVLQVSCDGGTPVGEKLYVYGSIGLPGFPEKGINPLLAASPANPYSPLMVRDLNDLNAISGTDGISIVAGAINLFEVNVNAVRDIHLKLVGSGCAVTAIVRPYRHVGQ